MEAAGEVVEVGLGLTGRQVLSRQKRKQFKPKRMDATML